MKNKYSIIIPIFQIVVGVLAIGAFAVLGLDGENITKWIVTFILAIGYVVLGILGIVDYLSKN